ncbi:MAG: alpha-L-rhamnosidase, partial [Bacteroidia bacterium]|nr:alpha-L-rhamnosidase [Bacteroidia bacterium]
LGPRFPGEAQLTPKSVTATSIYYYDLRLLSLMADLTDNKGDAAYYGKLAEDVRKSFNKMFLNPSTKVYSTGSQTAYSMPLYFDMVDDSLRQEVVDNLIKSINENKKALTAGDIGYRYLLRVLEQEGHSQLIYEMNSRDDIPGYGFQLAKGATALTESWPALKYVSNNHLMLGHLMEWFYSGVAGIRQAPGSTGYKNIIIAPDIVGDLTHAEASLNTINGKINSSWFIENGTLNIKISIPVSCIATVEIPCSDPDKITESGSQIADSENIIKYQIKGDKTICEIQSGDYIFMSPFGKP